MNFNAILKKKKITQSELANKLGITQSAVSQWSKKITFPRVPELLKLKEILSLTSDEIFSLFEITQKEVC